MNPQLQQLQKQIEDIQKQIQQFYRSSSIDRNVETAFKERLFFGLKGILYGDGSSTLTAITPLAGTKVYYVSDSNGGLITRKLTFQNGILISET